jgi:TPR repeat protein
MKKENEAHWVHAVVESAFPWKLPSSHSGFPKYSGKMSALEWKNLLAKAKGGEAEAECRIGEHCSDGCKDRRGRVLIRVSERKAAEWYRRAAEHGYGSAQNNLGVILGGNYGVTKNVREALFWLKRAYRGGDTCCAPNNIAITYRENGGLRQAVRWFRRAAALGDDGVLVQLGIHAYWGRGVRIDHEAAVRYFRKAIKGKNISESDRDDAFFYLGIAYLEGKGIRKSIPMARKHFERANKDNDHLAAQRLLRQMKRLANRS